jgi:gas vesicle protein
MAEFEASGDEPYPVEQPEGHPVAGGFAAGLVVGVLLGAGIALLYAPDRGSRTRSNLSRRLRRLRDEAGAELERVGGRTRRDLQRHRRELQDRLERAAERARDRLS